METINKYEIKQTAWEQKTFIAKRALLPMSELKDFFGRAYGEIYTALGSKGIMGGAPFAIYFSVDEEKKKTDLAAAVAIDKPIELEGFEKITIPNAKALLLTYYGSYENMAPAYEELEKYLAENKLQKRWMLEQYLSDPAVERDPSKWETNIFCILK